MAQREGDDILHQEETEGVIAAVIEEGVGLNNAAIADAVVAHALNSTFSDTEVEAALNALGTKINAVLAVLRTNGLIDT
jgi:transcription initiation factor IIE alpha subunit